MYVTKQCASSPCTYGRAFPKRRKNRGPLQTSVVQCNRISGVCNLEYPSLSLLQTSNTLTCWEGGVLSRNSANGIGSGSLLISGPAWVAFSFSFMAFTMLWIGV